MESRVNYITVGIFLLMLSAAFIVGVFWLSAGETGRSYKTYLVILDESVAGLSQQNVVKYNGVNVGFVKSIGLNKENPQQVNVLIKVDDEVPITESTVAKLMYQGVTGLAYLGLKVETASAPLLKAKPGEDYPVIKTIPSIRVQVDTVISQVSKNINTLTENIDKVFTPANQRALQNSLANMERFSLALANNSMEIDNTLKHSEAFMKNASRASEKLPELMEHLNKTADQVAGMSKNLNKASEKAEMTLDDTRLAIKSFSEQAVPELIRALNRITSAAYSIEAMANDIKANPSVIVRGRESYPAGPGE